MKTVEIAGELISYYYKDEDGSTVPMDLLDEDCDTIEMMLDRGEDRGELSSFVGRSEIVCHWSVNYEDD